MSNKTPRKPVGETGSGRKPKNPLGLWLGGALMLFGILAVFSGLSSLLDNKQRLVAPNGLLSVEVVDTGETRRRGLSDRGSLPNDQGMLFVFDESSEDHCIWMKDMQFPLDIIWLNDEKRVVHVEESIAPETYPSSFCPSAPARYVLEINSGQAKKLDLVKDATVRF